MANTEPVASAEPQPTESDEPKTTAEPQPSNEPDPVTEPNPSGDFESSLKSTLIPGEIETVTERELPTSSVTELELSTDEKLPQNTPAIIEHSTEVQNTMMPKDSAEEALEDSTEATTTNKISDETVTELSGTELPSVMKETDSSVNSFATNVPTDKKSETTTPMTLEETTLLNNEKLADDVALPVIPLMSDTEDAVTTSHSYSEDHSESTVVATMGTTMMENHNEDKMTTMSSNETPQADQVTETNMAQDEAVKTTTMNVNNVESGIINSSSESNSTSLSSTQSSISDESTVIPETTPLVADTKSEHTTEMNVVENNNTEASNEESKLQNVPSSVLSDDSSIMQPESRVHETNETNVIEHMPTTVFPKLPKNFGHNVEPLIEPLKNNTEEEHIMLISKTEDTSEVYDPHAIIPQLIPEQRVQSSNATGVPEGLAVENKVRSSTEAVQTVLHRSTIRPEENVVSAGDSVRSEDNLDHSTSHPLHPAVFPENAVEHATEKFDPTYDKHADDMSPFLPDIQKEKEVKKAPRLDKDEQDAPNPFEGHVEDVVTYKSPVEASSKKPNANETDSKDSLNDVKRSGDKEEEKNEVGRGFKNDGLEVAEVNSTETGIHNGLHSYDINKDVVKNVEDIANEKESRESSEEDEEALRVVPLEEQFKETETTVNNVDKSKSETTTESNAVSTTRTKGDEQQSEGPMNNVTTSEKPEENAVEDHYNDITDDTLPKGYQQDDSEIRKKIKDVSKKFIDKGEKLFKIIDKMNATANDTEDTMTTIASVADKHAEDAKLTTQIPVLPLEIQQEMSTTEKIESTTVTEEIPRKDNSTEGQHSARVSTEDVSTTTVQVPTTHTMLTETKTTAQVPILPEELQTTESDVLLTTSTVKPDAEMKSSNSENVRSDEQKDSPSTTVDGVNNNSTEDSLTNAGQQTNIQNKTIDDLVISGVEHVGNKSIDNTWLRPNASLLDNVNEKNVSTMSIEGNVMQRNVTESSTSEAVPSISNETVTATESYKQMSESSSTTEDVRPVTEILEDDTEPIGFDYRTHLVTTTPKTVLSDLDVGELSEEDLKVIPLEKSLEVKKKSVDKKIIDKYRYKKEKELSLEDEDENAVTEIPEPATVFSTEIPQMVTENDNVQEENQNETNIDVNVEGNSAPIPRLKIIETTTGSNQTKVQTAETSSNERENLNDKISITVPDSSKKYPSFIPVSEKIIEPEPVTEPFMVLRNFHLHRSSVDFTTEKPTVSVQPRNEGHVEMEPGQVIELDGKLNQAGSQPSVFPLIQSSVASIAQEANHVAKQSTDATVPPSTQTKLPDAVVESTSHIDVSFLDLPPNSVFSKCTAGQFQCANGTSRDGAYCVKLSAKCDSENDCSDGSDELNCEEEGCPGNFQCSSGQCLKRDLVCNKIVDCDDGSDEKNCEEWKCQFDEFKCPSGEFLLINYFL